MHEKEQKIEDIHDSMVNQAGRDIIINNGLSYPVVKDICETTIRYEVEKLTSNAKAELMKMVDVFHSEFCKRLEAIENKTNIKKLEKPSMQFCLHSALMESASTDDESVRKELMDILIDRLNADEESTEKVIMEEAIEKAAKLSKPLKALMVGMLMRNMINPNGFLLKEMFAWYGELYKELEHLTGLDIAFGRQLQCVYPMSGLLSSATIEDHLLRNYDLLFRHRGKYGDLKRFAATHTCFLGRVDIMWKDAQIFYVSFNSNDDKRKITDDTDYYFMSPSSTHLIGLLRSQGRDDIAQALLEYINVFPLYTPEELRNALHEINSGWDFLFSTFDRNEVRPLMLSPVGNYLAMIYCRKFGAGTGTFLRELYSVNGGDFN
jgi:hypothetical protein